MSDTAEMKVTALAPWFGSNRILARNVGEALQGCEWVGVPFAGGMSELAHIKARTIHANDLHRHVINLARVVQCDSSRAALIRRLRRSLFHPDQLAESQLQCRDLEPGDAPDEDAAYHYFICCWMGRSHKAGVDDEFNGGCSIRWNSNGGDSAVRYWSAMRSLGAWGRIFRRCTFGTDDALEFIDRCEDAPRHGLYVDPPFPGPGDRYRHQFKNQTGLATALKRFTKTRVVCRFYDHPLIRDLYPQSHWQWQHFAGRTQANEKAPEVLLLNCQTASKQNTAALFA